MRRVLFILLALTATMPLRAQANAQSSLTSLLPVEKSISPWRPSDQPKTYTKKQLYDYINGGAEIYFEFGFEAVLVQEYSAGERTVVVEIYQMCDSSAAYGIYSINRDPAMPRLNIGDDATAFEYHIAVWQGRYYIVVMGYSANEESRKALEMLGRKISERIGEHSRPPQLITELPSVHLVERSQRWIEGVLALNNQYFFSTENVWALDGKNATVAVADYASSDDSATLIVAMYHKPNIAKQALEHIAAALDEKLGARKETSLRTFHWRDKQGRTYLLAQADQHIVSVLQATDESFAKQLLHEALTATKTIE